VEKAPSAPNNGGTGKGRTALSLSGPPIIGGGGGRFLRRIASLCLALLAARSALATVEVGQVIWSESDRVFLNFTCNHDYYARDRVFRYRHSVAALEVVRERLVRQKKIRPLPLVVRIPDPGFSGSPKQTRIALQRRGDLIQGDRITRSLGPCYEITVVGDDSYDTLLALTVALPRLTPAHPVLAVPDVSRLGADLSAFRGIEIRHDPIPARDWQYVLYTIWRDGSVRFALEDRTSGALRSLEPLDGYPATRAVRSPDARYFAYASLRQIKLFDRRENRTRTIPLSPEIPAPNEVLLGFNDSGTRLVFTGDRNLLSEYPVFVHDLQSGETHRADILTGRPESWPREVERWADLPAPKAETKALSPSFEPGGDEAARVAVPLATAGGGLLVLLAVGAARHRRRKLRQ